MREHRVRITTSGVDSNFTQAQIDATKKRLGASYSRSGEQVTITNEMARDFLMETSTKVPPEKLPARYNVNTELRQTVGRGSNDQANFELTSK